MVGTPYHPRVIFVCSILVTALLVLMGSVEISLGAGPPKRRPHGQNERLVVKSGITLRLKCPVEPDPTLLVEWMKDGHVIRPGWDARYRLVSSSAVFESGADLSSGAAGAAIALRIRDVTLADTGIFVCLATNGFGTVDMLFNVIVIASEPNDTEILSDNNSIVENTSRESDEQPPKFNALDKMTPHLTLPVGRTEKLTCASSGHPTPLVTWYKDGVRLQTSDAYGVVEDQLQQLVLSDVKKSDGGTYQCLVGNALGNISFTYQVYVIDGINLRPEFFLTHPHNVSVSRGHSASFNCYVRSPSEPRIQWLKRIDSLLPLTGVGAERGGSGDVTVITYDDHYYAVVGGGGSLEQYETGIMQRRDGTYLSKLKIRRVIEHDAGLYVCSATNHAGYTYRQAYLQLRKGDVIANVTALGGVLMTSSHSVIDNSYLTLVIVAGVLTTFVVTAIIIIAAFRRHHRQPGSAQSSRASSSNSSGHLLGRSMAVVVASQPFTSSSSLPLKTNVVGSVSEGAFATQVGMKNDGLATQIGTKNDGLYVVQRTLTFDKNPHLRRHLPSDENVRLRQPDDVDEFAIGTIAESRTAPTMPRSRNNNCDVIAVERYREMKAAPMSDLISSSSSSSSSSCDKRETSIYVGSKSSSTRSGGLGQGQGRTLNAVSRAPVTSASSRSATSGRMFGASTG